MSAEPSLERYEFDWEIVGLIDEYGSERAALRATYARLKRLHKRTDRRANEPLPITPPQGARPPHEVMADA